MSCYCGLITWPRSSKRSLFTPRELRVLLKGYVAPYAYLNRFPRTDLSFDDSHDPDAAPQKRGARGGIRRWTYGQSLWCPNNHRFDQIHRLVGRTLLLPYLGDFCASCESFRRTNCDSKAVDEGSCPGLFPLQVNKGEDGRSDRSTGCLA